MVASARLLWHPRRENRFVVGGASQITLYDWLPEKPEIRHATSQHDLQLMKCFAWSPDANFDDLIAIGLSTGRVDLMRLEATKHARDNILSSGPCVSLPVRSSRSCNALAFCPADPNYLAVGLDKVRGDSSLIIWDISTATPALSFSASIASSATVDLPPPKTRPQPMIPRADFGTKMDSRILQQHAPTEIVSSLSFVEQSSSLLWAGISNRWLRLFDLRTAVPSTNNVASKVQGIATDPFDHHRIGTFGDGVVSIWDSRRLPHPVMTFTEKDASADGVKPQMNPSTFTTLEFSPVRRSVVATLERDATHVRFWDLQEVQVNDQTHERSRDSSRSTSATRAGGGRLSWANPTNMLSWTGSSGSNMSSGDGRDRVPPPLPPTCILSNTRKTKDFPSTLTSFAIVPQTREHPLTSNLMVLNKEGDLEVHALHDTPNHARFSHLGDLSMAVGASYRVFPGFKDQEKGPDPWDLPVPPATAPAAAVPKARTQDSQDRSPTATGQSTPARGRSQSMVSAPTFGRGDEDGFPAIGVAAATGSSSTAGGHKSRSATRAIIDEETRSRLTSSSRNASMSRALGSLAMRDRPLDQSDSLVVESPTTKGPEDGGSASVDKLAFHSSSHSSLSNRRSSHHRREKQTSYSMRYTIESDISMVMRRRALKGYGLGSLGHNSVACSEDPILSELWLWISYAKRLLQAPKPTRVHGYDFSCQGLLGIWEGFPATGRGAGGAAPPSSPVAGLKSLLLEHATLDLGQISTARSHSRNSSSRRTSHQFIDTSSINGPANGPQDEFAQALNALSASHGDIGRGSESWKPGTQTAKLSQRRFGLQLCGWSLREEELNNAVRIWESEKKHSQAACWLVFTGQHQRAVELLMRSKDETHYLISGTLAALIPPSSTPGAGLKNNSDLRQHCERIIVRLQDPYLRAMLTHLTVNDWSEVLDEESIPLRERLAIALQFLDDKSLSSYLRRIADEAVHRGDISGVIVTGLNSTGIEIMQSYVDTTGDVQTAAILSSFRAASSLVNSGRLSAREESKRVVIERWVETYQDLLDGWKMFYHRCQFDIDRGKLMQEAVRDGDIPPGVEWVPRQIMIRCNFCNKTIDVNNQNAKNRSTSACTHCGRALPRCSICLMTLTISPDHVRDANLVHNPTKDTINDAIVFCVSCRHGGHSSHVLSFFSTPTTTCPVAGCDCLCANEM